MAATRVGTALIEDDALLSIVRGAVAGVEGARLDTPGRVSRVLPGRRSAVAWRVEGARARFDVDVAAGYGHVLPALAADVQAAVAADVARMTGLTVTGVDVTVTSIDRAPEQRR